MSRLRAVLERFRRFLLPRDGREPLGKYIRHHLPVLLIIFLLTIGAEKLGLLGGKESFYLDFLFSLRSKELAKDIVLVTIDDQDYLETFNETSPLAADKIQSLIADIARGGPRAIAVDLETAHPSFQGKTWPPAVWVRQAWPVAPEEVAAVDRLYNEQALEEIELGTALGGDLAEQPVDAAGFVTTQPRSAPSLTLEDGDGVLRHFRMAYRAVGPDHKSSYIEGFPLAVARAYTDALVGVGMSGAAEVEHVKKRLKHGAAHLTEPFLINFAGPPGRFKQISATVVRRAALQSFWATNSPLRDKLVIVGGAYAAARDEYVTPVGPMLGVEIVAAAVECVLDGTAVGKFNHYVAYALDLVVGLAFLYVTWRFPGHGSFVLAIFSIIALAMAASFIAFRAFAFWFNFVPIMFGQMLHLRWEKSKENRKHHEELLALRVEVAELRKSLAEKTERK